MCGRYRLAKKKQILAETFDTENEVDWSPRYNIAPGQDVVVIRQDAGQPKRLISLMRWGLVPAWAKDVKAGYKMINARAESVADTPAFRDPFRSRRCLVPADGFYEWSKGGKQKTPFLFSMADDSPFAFAGVWDRWKKPDKTWVETCSIVTTSANALLSGIHDRMPVILKSENYDLWLDPGFHNANELLEVVKPFSAEAMRRHSVSTRVNFVTNDDPACAEEYAPNRLF
jgi:putative SOS response-associated peptidase YedK